MFRGPVRNFQNFEVLYRLDWKISYFCQFWSSSVPDFEIFINPRPVRHLNFLLILVRIEVSNSQFLGPGPVLGPISFVPWNLDWKNKDNICSRQYFDQGPSGPTWSVIFQIFWSWSMSVLDFSKYLALVWSGPVLNFHFLSWTSSGPWIPDFDL